MKRTLTFLTVFAMVLALSTVVLADGENVQTGVGAQGACAYGSCFAPNYDAEGEVAVFKGKAADVIVQSADCCVAGDTYKLIVKSAVAKDKVKWMSGGTLKADCDFTTTTAWPDQRQLSLAAAKKVKLKAIALPGGVPAGAYVRINQAGWIQKKGYDGCGMGM